VLLAGYHGTLKGDCISCHKEHPGATRSVIPLDKQKFDHSLAAYKLEGKHAKVQCDECHQKQRTKEAPGIYYVGLKYRACADCHRDPHSRQFAAACEKCHAVQGWTGSELRFAHDLDSAYKLEGRHKTVECIKCHKPKAPAATLGSAPFKGLARECAGCHRDVHRQQFAAACTACHTTAGWTKRNLVFSHAADSTFPLVGKHAQVRCEKCHRPPQRGQPLGLALFRGLSKDCCDCHRDPHRGQLELACTKCHFPGGWRLKQVQFDHTRDSQYPLTGKHASVGCIKCHQPLDSRGRLGSAQFKALAKACEGCHKVNHPVQYGLVCVSCHTTDLWQKKAPGVEHFLKYAFSSETLSGKHLQAECRACHKQTAIREVGQGSRSDYQCQTCHQADDPHQGLLGWDCAKCHVQTAWKGEPLRFDHNTMSRYPLDQHHETVACVKCHENNRWKPLDTACKTCHPKKF
jgi:hypothetical protein